LLTSTTLLIGRIPAAVSRSAIHRADGPTRTPPITVDVKRPQRSPSMISTVVTAPPSTTFGSGGAGGVKATPSLAARSRATPTYDQQSGRLRVTSTSRTTSSRRPVTSP
jgi:hypothetical protein